MGRIDEALRREGKIGHVDRSSERRGQMDEFASPWTFREGNEGRPGSNPLAAALDGGTEPTLHGLRHCSDAWLPRLVIAERANRLLVEEFRQLAATLHQAQATSNVRVLMVTSAQPGEGKSTTAVNLALTFSESYRRKVLLLDADLRRPTLHEITQVSNVRGLAETLKGAGEDKLPLFQLSEKLMVAPAGRPDPNPMGPLASPRMRQILLEAATRFDWVIIDAPPIGVIADASLLAPLSDGVLLVVRARRTHYAAVQKAVEAVGIERVIGVVLNDAEVDESEAYRYYYSHSADEVQG
jgi:protein-tyrosine kinase